MAYANTTFILFYVSRPNKQLKSTVYWAYLGRSWPLDPPIGRVLANPRPYGAGAYPCKSAEAPYRRGGAAGVGSEYNIKRSEWSGDSLTFRVTTRRVTMLVARRNRPGASACAFVCPRLLLQDTRRRTHRRTGARSGAHVHHRRHRPPQISATHGAPAAATPPQPVGHVSD